VSGNKPLWARPACDPELPASLRQLVLEPQRLSRRRRWHRSWRLDRELAGQAGRVVYPHQLDHEGRRLLARAQNAIETILASDVRATGLLEADEPPLRRHEWDIACAARSLTEVRALPTAEGEVGAMTAAVADAQRRALRLAEQSAADRVSALERYAHEVAAADIAHNDWHEALRLSGLNDRYLDLVARTAADELAVVELGELRGQAEITVQVLRDSLRDASVAAEALALPPTAAS
jgi:hypothetical protein